jgi:hypothetical protein
MLYMILLAILAVVTCGTIAVLRKRKAIIDYYYDMAIIYSYHNGWIRDEIRKVQDICFPEEEDRWDY